MSTEISSGTLAFRLLLEDLDAQPHVGGDDGLAMGAMRDELRGRIALMENYGAMAELLEADDRAERANQVTVLQFVREDLQTVRDRDFAHQMASIGRLLDRLQPFRDFEEGDASDEDTRAASTSSIAGSESASVGETIDDLGSVIDGITLTSQDLEEDLEERNLDDDERMESRTSGSFPSGDQQGEKDLTGTFIECVACTDKKLYFDIIQLPCEPAPHNYCKECVVRLFELSLSPAGKFPPICCGQSVSVSTVKEFLTDRMLNQIRGKFIELSTPNRIYCHNAACSAFIPSENINGSTARCPRCPARTCTVCKQEAHCGLCLEDTHVRELLETAAHQGWQRCYVCGTMVELLQGCNHMSCTCGAEFCYDCGEPWKNCDCEYAELERVIPGGPDDEEYFPPVILDVNQFVLPAGQPLMRPVRQDRVQRLNDGCNHNAGWEQVRQMDGFNTVCSLCHRNRRRQRRPPALEWVYRCQMCFGHVCGQCRRNLGHAADWQRHLEGGQHAFRHHAHNEQAEVEDLLMPAAPHPTPVQEAAEDDADLDSLAGIW